MLVTRKKLYGFDHQHTSSYLLWLNITGLYQDTKAGFERIAFHFSFLSYDLTLYLCRSIYAKHILIKINIYSILIITIKYVMVIHIIRLYGAKEILKPSTKGMNRPLEAVP